MAFSPFPVNDNALASHDFGMKTISSRKFMGHISVAADEGGATPYQNLDVDETGVVVKSSTGQLYGGMAFNLYGITPSGLPSLYLKIYDKATAPTSGDTPKLTIPLESGEPVPIIIPACGVAFALGIGLRCTTGLAVADTGAPITNACVVNLFYL